MRAHDRQRRLPALAVLILLFLSNPGLGSELLRPGLFLYWTVETEDRARSSTEILSLSVINRDEGGLAELEINYESAGESRFFRVSYDARLDASTFAPGRFLNAREKDGKTWRDVSSEDLIVIDLLRDMDERVSASTAVAESTLSVDGIPLSCKRHQLDAEWEERQESESVILTTVHRTTGEAWLCDALPLGGWVIYREERTSRRRSEMRGQVFESEPSTSSLTWQLRQLTLPQ